MPFPGDEVVVTDLSNSRLAIFSEQGDFKRHLPGKFDQPYGVAIVPDAVEGGGRPGGTSCGYFGSGIVAVPPALTSYISVSGCSGRHLRRQHAPPLSFCPPHHACRPLPSPCPLRARRGRAARCRVP